MLLGKAFSFTARPTTTRVAHRLNVATVRDADFVERMVGGERYEMVPLPDSMVSKTVFVGNLGEFVTDDILSGLFQAVSKLRSVPACVARKPNMSSMQYGFVHFLTVEEKEASSAPRLSRLTCPPTHMFVQAAILRFHGTELHGRTIKVEEIRDTPHQKRVRVPGKMVAYACGEAKRTRDGRVNNLRRISRDDVERLSRGQPSKTRGYGSRNVPHRLNEEERQEMDRASRKGYVTLAGTGYRRGRKGSPLANIHRQWCDARDKPQIILCKASGGRQLDNVIVDLSPLRINGLFDDAAQVEDFLVKWKAQILTAAENAGMELREGYVEDNTVDNMESLDGDDDDDNVRTEYTTIVDVEAWATQPIWRLPVVSMGVFEGDRSKAKVMASGLASLWGIPETHVEGGGGAESRRITSTRKGGRTKMKGLRHNRRGGRGQDVW